MDNFNILCKFNSQYISVTIKMISSLVQCRFYFASMYPKFASISGNTKRKLHVIHSSEANTLVPESERSDFIKNNSVETIDNGVKTVFVSEKAVAKLKIKKNTIVEFSTSIQEQNNFVGIASKLLANSFVFSRKEK